MIVMPAVFLLYHPSFFLFFPRPLDLSIRFPHVSCFLSIRYAYVVCFLSLSVLFLSLVTIISNSSACLLSQHISCCLFFVTCFSEKTALRATHSHLALMIVLVCTHASVCLLIFLRRRITSCASRIERKSNKTE